MRVNQSTSNQVQGSESAAPKKTEKTEKSGAAKKAEKTHGGERANVSNDANTEISSRAKEMASAKAAATDAPETREEKIAALKARIAAGKYNVDSDAVADRMVDDHLRMSGIG